MTETPKAYQIRPGVYVLAPRGQSLQLDGNASKPYLDEGSPHAEPPEPATIEAPKRQPTAEEFWREQRAEPDFESRRREALNSLPPTGPISRGPPTTK